MKTKTNLLAVTTAALLLAGCSGEPIVGAWSMCSMDDGSGHWRSKSYLTRMQYEASGSWKEELVFYSEPDCKGELVHGWLDSGKYKAVEVEPRRNTDSTYEIDYFTEEERKISHENDDEGLLKKRYTEKDWELYEGTSHTLVGFKGDKLYQATYSGEETDELGSDYRPTKLFYEYSLIKE